VNNNGVLFTRACSFASWCSRERLLKTTIVNNNGVLFTRACSFAALSNYSKLLKTTIVNNNGVLLSRACSFASKATATQDHNREQQRRAVPAGLLFRCPLGQKATQDHNREQQRRAVPAGLLFRFLIFFSPLLKTTIVNNNGVLFTRACSFADQRTVLTSPSETSQGPPITHVARRQHEVLGSAQRQ